MIDVDYPAQRGKAQRAAGTLGQVLSAGADILLAYSAVSSAHQRAVAQATVVARSLSRALLAYAQGQPDKGA